MPTLRTVEIQPPSRSSEAFNVAIAGGIIALAAIYGIAFRNSAAAATETSGPPDNLPFQLGFQDLPSVEQRIVREMIEGFTEAKRLRASSGRWPDPAALAADGVPPFAKDALDRQGYRWTLRHDGLISNYLGVPGEVAAATFLLLIQEPAPGGETSQAGVVDEEHQLLPDGALLHVTYWKRASGAPGEGQDSILTRPEAQGWSQIRLLAPAKAAP